MDSQLLILARLHPAFPPPHERSRPAVGTAKHDPGPHFQIRTVVTSCAGHRADQLVARRYAWRGYRSSPSCGEPAVQRTTLMAVAQGRTIGTLTVRSDGALPLKCEQTFPDEIAALRARGHRLAEFTRLAVDPGEGSAAVLAGLFHAAFLVAHRARRSDRLVMEVHPRHARHHQRVLGAEVVGGGRLHDGVGAPALLLTASFDDIAWRIDHARDARRRSSRVRSPMAHAFCTEQEAWIVSRLAHLVQ